MYFFEIVVEAFFGVEERGVSLLFPASTVASSWSVSLSSISISSGAFFGGDVLLLVLCFVVIGVVDFDLLAVAVVGLFPVAVVGLRTSSMLESSEIGFFRGATERNGVDQFEGLVFIANQFEDLVLA
jgi:hypothetical protein